MKNKPEGIVLDLPLPPSTNHLFATVGRKRIKTKKYKQWINECMNECIVQGRRGPVNSENGYKVMIFPCFKRGRRDIDNTVKPTLDFLEKAGFYENDKEVESLNVRRSDPSEESELTDGRMLVVVLPRATTSASCS